MPEQIDFLASHIAPTETYVLLDIGANIGLFTRQVLNAFPNITVAHCVEPDPANHRALRANLSGVKGAVVFTHQVALGPESGTTTFFRDTENCGNNSVHADAMRDRPFVQSSTFIAAAGPWLTENLLGKEPVIWKSDTQGNDEAIVAVTPWPLWRRVQVAVIELWRIQTPVNWVPDFLERVADMPYRRLGTKDVSTDDVARYLASEDWTFEDLYLWR